MRLLLCLLPVFAASAFGQLTWEKPLQTFVPAPLDKGIIAHYRFANRGRLPITIREVRTSCGCTTVALSKRDYAPGESGEVEARFQFLGRIGHQEKWIYVATDFPLEDPVWLRLVVDIPETVSIEPELLRWRLGDRLEPKTLRIAVAEGFPARVTSVRSNDPSIKVEVRETQPGKVLEANVTPNATAEPKNAVLSIQTDYPPEHPDVYHAFVRVE